MGQKLTTEQDGGVNNPAHTEEILFITRVWPRLPEAIRAGILAMVDAFLDRDAEREEETESIEKDEQHQ